MTTQTPERNKRGTVMLSDDEKRDVQLVGAFLNLTESDVLRSFTVVDITAKAESIRKTARAA